MKHVYSVIQSMETCKIFACEWNIEKETEKTVTYYSGSKSNRFTKNKDTFNTVHLNTKDSYTGKNQCAYVLVIAETEKEAIQIATPIFREWLEGLLLELKEDK